MDPFDARALQARLHAAGVLPTLQRMAVAAVLLPRPVHMTAEQVLHAARAVLPGISRATVYSVLRLFARQGLLKELPIDGVATVYDSNLTPHHHLYDVDTGAVTDLMPGQLQVVGLGDLGEGVELQEVDVIVRVRSKARPGLPAADAA